ncbi:DinB family protein [Metasolibacillus sp. FSL H7-0170]|uniref:DinB family protein n=1 Tax=Metasolibacillus sp. FSL H7-0170 TaxID=2921431 RepID=UPI0031581163
MKERHEILFNQLASYRNTTLSLLKDVTAEDAEIIPNKFNNNIRWNMGHIYLDQYLWIETQTKERINVPSEFNSWFGYGTSPTSFTSKTPSYEELKVLLENQIEDIKEKYASKLEIKYSPTEMGMNTIEQVLIRTIFHEGIHFQTILNLKKLIK